MNPVTLITLAFAPKTISPDIYQLRIDGSKIEDVFGSQLVGSSGVQGSEFLKTLGDAGSVGGIFQPDSTPTVRPGIVETTGPYVAFPEFAKRKLPEPGFNPNDKVETRVVRLYYYRDAHRIAQIVNRKVKSYNRQAVDTYRQLADKARNQASQRTVARQKAERNAIIVATETRQKERELQRAENSLNGALRQLTNYRRENPEANADSDPLIRQFESLVSTFSNQVDGLRSQVQNLRDREVQANEVTQQAEAQEKLAREEQFRREVAAAHADPDTYAPGTLDSEDPIEQVSVSVVGEGLIQLRGPLKGVNLIRIAIDQLDSPVGQVRVSVHTIQINGEKADKMEEVARDIQANIDQARFLTMQTSEMLRKSVVQVASRKAEEASAMAPGQTQMERDERYINAFFGKDFIDELKVMDSEFLHSGNKLLSLHSMDTTSLASALNLMALAKNSTRQEIFHVFDTMLATELPEAESRYLASNYSCPKKNWKCWHHCKCEPGYCSLAGNASFESLRGFFDTQIVDDNTMTPLQREFIRLAQIFKSRLITEMEYKQRVKERAIIEERIGNPQDELRAAAERERVAKEKLTQVEEKIVSARVDLITKTTEATSAIRSALAAVADMPADSEISQLLRAAKDLNTATQGQATRSASKRAVPYNGKTLTLQMIDAAKIQVGPMTNQSLREGYDLAYGNVKAIYDVIQKIDDLGDNEFSETYKHWSQFEKSFKSLSAGVISTFDEVSIDSDSSRALQIPIEELTEPLNFIEELLRIPDSNILQIVDNKLEKRITDLLLLLREDNFDSKKFYLTWSKIRSEYFDPVISRLEKVKDAPQRVSETLSAAKLSLDQVDRGVRELISAGAEFQFAQVTANKSRRPLDHKKFLDMLIDDLEEKYIELLDGTRAHVANIDNYLKRVTTALDDDFNTQFYYPVFRQVRENSQTRDVQFGQTETTTVLANNREFAKADPSATMEFDLPKRDILLTEGITSAKALIDDVGALANDPTFLAMAKLKSPNSPNDPGPGSTLGQGVVRSVLPGLGGTTSEQILSQNSNGGPAIRVEP